MGKAGVVKLGAALALALLAAACAAPPQATTSTTTAPPSAPPVIEAPPPAPPPPVPPPRLSQAPRPARDACGAAALAYLVGRPRTEIPIPLEPGRRRVLCATCPIDRDVQPWRQTILYDDRTGLVTSVACG
jgi:hypothetical protein